MSEEEIKGRVGVDSYQVYGGYRIGMWSGWWHEIDEKITIFVDNLPKFQRYGGAMRAITRLNGKTWSGGELFVTMSKFNKRDANRQGDLTGKELPKFRQQWIEVRKSNQNDALEVVIPTMRNEKAVKAKKEICAGWYGEQRDRLNRSLLRVCVKPIEFRKVMNRLIDAWMGSGEIECRDVGPYRCLLIFSSPEIKDEAMNNEWILSVFDEVRPHWELFLSLSRRVWVEIMGLPVGLWCTETFNSLAKLWGKMIKMDDRTEESNSFTIKVLIRLFPMGEGA
ncbi:hypothetical protein PIB30_079969 [Stylosanthes scabra]|uniref:DUF4283 domain-containing protein n=1 Tax=Stylosanthes scabra TaxID=79078 RepID=A0ABU6RR44_9FABA|nr:hypothetical protein [Stylosanthes scabra]